MILSNVEIHRALDEGRLIIRPEPLPRFPDADLTARIKRRRLICVSVTRYPISKKGLRSTSIFDVVRLPNSCGPNSETRQITEDQPFVLKPNQFVLGRTLESIKLRY